MIETIIFWVVSFVGLFLASFWIQVIFFVNVEKKKIRHFPSVSLIVPAWNEERGIAKTLESVLKLNYPRNKVEVIVVDDGSKDRTLEVANRYVKRGVVVYSKENGGKATAVNFGIDRAKGDFVACIDADSTIHKDSLRNVMRNFTDEKIGAVISTIKIREPKSIWQKIQHYEYVLTSFIRKLMSDIDTLYVSPGVLSVYRTDVVKELGGFDEKDNLTEDLEIALRLRYNHYRVLIEPESMTYTEGPRTFWALWKQRVRWFRGLIQNSIKYRKMFFNPKYGPVGWFQLPLIAVTQFVLIISFTMILFHLAGTLYKELNSLALLGGKFFTSIELISIKELMYSINPMILLPLVIALAMSWFLLNMAHKNIGENWMYLPVLLFYFFLLPLLSAFHWAWAITLEVFGTKRKWR